MFEERIDEIKTALGSKNRRTRRLWIGIIVTPFIFIWLVVLIVIGDWQANANLFKKWFYPNAMDVVAENGIDINAVSVQWKTDLMPGTIEVYKNGELVYDNFREQEDNYFTVFYQNEAIATFDQVKKKGVYGHHYHFYIKKSNNQWQVNLSIEGRDTTYTKIK